MHARHRIAAALLYSALAACATHVDSMSDADGGPGSGGSDDVDSCEGDDCDPDGEDLEPGDGDVVGELVMLRQTMPGNNSVLREIGKAEAQFWNYRPLPVDDRAEFQTDAGEPCKLEFDSNYPRSYKGASWPDPPFLDAGDLVFSAAGAPGAVVLETLAYSNGTGYVHRNQPEPLKEGYTTYSDLVDPVFAPAGASYSVDAVGGLEIGPDQWAEGTIPGEFTVVEPDIENGSPTVDLTEGMVVRWNPPEPDAEMNLSLALMSFGGGTALLRCRLADDGEVSLPADAVSSFAFNNVGLMLMRVHRTRVAAETLQGQRVIVDLVGQTQRTRLISTTKEL